MKTGIQIINKFKFYLEYFESLNMRLIRIICHLFVGITLFISPVNAAEVLQITNSTDLQIGDNNRTYRIRLACLKVQPENEADAMKWLRVNLPRRTKVNLRPKGVEDGVLLAKIETIKMKQDIGLKISDLGLGELKC